MRCVTNGSTTVQHVDTEISRFHMRRELWTSPSAERERSPVHLMGHMIHTSYHSSLVPARSSHFSTSGKP